MSGGSYDYLCYAGIEKIGQRRGALERMAARLKRISPDSHAACDTVEVITILATLERAVDRLTDVWRAVEWCDSGDTGRDDMMSALAEYESRRAAEESIEA